MSHLHPTVCRYFTAGSQCITLSKRSLSNDWMIGKYATTWQYKFDNGKLLKLVGKGIKNGNSERQKAIQIQKRKLRSLF